MPTKVEIPASFSRDLRRLARKYPKIVDLVDSLVAQLREDQRPGVKLIGTGYNLYKVRLANPSAGRGKSGGFRVIYYVKFTDRILMVTVYSKTEEKDLSPERIRQILQNLKSPDE